MIHNEKFKGFPDFILELLAKQVYTGLTKDENEQLIRWKSENPEEIASCNEFSTAIKKIYWLSLRKGISHEKAWLSLQYKLRRKKKMSNMLIRIVGFAAALFVFAASIWYLSGSDSPDKHVESANNSLVIPERNQKAILVLSSGEQHILDNPEHTSLIESNGLSIQNKPGDILQYNQNGQPTETIAFNKLIVPRGSRYRVQLSDGTKVWINSDTELNYPVIFSDTERRLKITGEAFFEITGDPKRPFIIEADGYELKVLGTSLNISSYKNDHNFETTLVKGAVEVKNLTGEAVKLQPGQLITINRIDQTSTIRNVDHKLYTSWKDGVLYFEKITLMDLMIKFERWYNVEITFDNQELKQLVYSGALENSRNIEFLLNLISKTTEIEFELIGERIIVRKTESKVKSG